MSKTKGLPVYAKKAQRLDFTYSVLLVGDISHNMSSHKSAMFFCFSSKRISNSIRTYVLIISFVPFELTRSNVWVDSKFLLHMVCVGLFFLLMIALN